MIPDRTDRTAAEAGRLGGADESGEHDCGVRHRIEEQVEMVIGKRLAAQGGNRRHPAAIGDEDEKGRSIGDPGHVADGIGDAALHHLVIDNDDVALLQVTLRRSR